MDYKSKLESWSIVIGAVICFGVAIWLLLFGPLSNSTLTRNLTTYSTQLYIVDKDYIPPISSRKIPLEDSKLKLEAQIIGPRYLKTDTPIEIRILSAKLKIEKNKFLDELDKEQGPGITIWINSSSCPFLYESVSRFDLGVKGGPMGITDGHSHWNIQFETTKSPIEVEYLTSGGKNLCYQILWPMGDGEIKRITGKINNWFEVESASVTINLLLARASFILALLAAPFAVGKIIRSIWVICLD